MTLQGYLIFVTVYALAVASPGPGVAAVIARAMSRGFWPTLPLALGITAGDLVWFGLSALGLAVIAAHFAPVFLVIKYAGAAYLAWIGWKMWTAKPSEKPAEAPRGEGSRAFMAGLALTLGNPKTIVFFLAILPNLIDLARISTLTLSVAALTILLILPAIMMAYAGATAWAAHRARTLLARQRQERLLNRIAGTAMIGAAAAIAAR